MRILWLCNIPLPQISRDLNMEVQNVGGWISGFANILEKLPDVELHYAFPSFGIKENFSGKVGNIKYHAFPALKRLRVAPIVDDLKINKKLTESISTIIKSVNPEMLHIFGTEMPHSLVASEIFNNPNKTIINIQGLISIYNDHFYADLPWSVRVRYTLGDILRGNMYLQVKRHVKRAINEIDTLNNVANVIGRTDWDEACSTQINAKLNYYFCNEVLRESFYSAQWELNKCERHSIFFSQAWQPLKGLHYLLRAMPLILRQYPDTILYVAGTDVTNEDTIAKKIRKTSYGYYIEKLIKDNRLSNNIVFTGSLSEEEMCNRFLKSHVFVSASTIENESNSISEAKIIGLPVVSSFVGGVTNRVEHNLDGYMYQHDAVYMLAFYVCKIFSDDKIAIEFSKRSREKALKLNNKEDNINTLLEIYQDVLRRK